MKYIFGLVSVFILTCCVCKRPPHQTYEGEVVNFQYSPSVEGALDGLLGGGKSAEFFLYVKTGDTLYEVEVLDGHRTNVRTSLIYSLSNCKKVKFTAFARCSKLITRYSQIEFVCKTQNHATK